MDGIDSPNIVQHYLGEHVEYNRPQVPTCVQTYKAVVQLVPGQDDS